MARREPHWVKLFLRELSRTGNVRMAAEAAGVDHTSAYQRRKRHGEFAEAWESALASRQAAPSDDGPLPPLASGESPSPPEGGEGLAPPSALRAATSPSKLREDEVARPDGKLIKASEARWSPRAEEAFLVELTVSGSVRRAAWAAGFSTTALYKRRLKDRHFAAAWDAAIETGKARVQAYLVEAAGRTFDPDDLPIGDERELPKVSISEAINIAKLKAAGPAYSADEGEEIDEDRLKAVRERILEKLQRLKERDQRELGEAGWTEWPLPPRPRGGEGGTVWLPPGYRLVGERMA